MSSPFPIPQGHGASIFGYQAGPVVALESAGLSPPEGENALLQDSWRIAQHWADIMDISHSSADGSVRVAQESFQETARIVGLDLHSVMGDGVAVSCYADGALQEDTGKNLIDVLKPGSSCQFCHLCAVATQKAKPSIWEGHMVAAMFKVECLSHGQYQVVVALEGRRYDIDSTDDKPRTRAHQGRVLKFQCDQETLREFVDKMKTTQLPQNMLSLDKVLPPAEITRACQQRGIGHTINFEEIKQERPGALLDAFSRNTDISVQASTQLLMATAGSPQEGLSRVKNFRFCRQMAELCYAVESYKRSSPSAWQLEHLRAANEEIVALYKRDFRGDISEEDRNTIDSKIAVLAQAIDGLHEKVESDFVPKPPTGIQGKMALKFHEYHSPAVQSVPVSVNNPAANIDALQVALVAPKDGAYLQNFCTNVRKLLTYDYNDPFVGQRIGAAVAAIGENLDFVDLSPVMPHSLSARFECLRMYRDALYDLDQMIYRVMPNGSQFLEFLSANPALMNTRYALQAHALQIYRDVALHCGNGTIPDGFGNPPGNSSPSRIRQFMPNRHFDPDGWECMIRELRLPIQKLSEDNPNYSPQCARLRDELYQKYGANGNKGFVLGVSFEMSKLPIVSNTFKYLIGDPPKGRMAEAFAYDRAHPPTNDERCFYELVKEYIFGLKEDSHGEEFADQRSKEGFLRRAMQRKALRESSRPLFDQYTLNREALFIDLNQGPIREAIERRAFEDLKKLLPGVQSAKMEKLIELLNYANAVENRLAEFEQHGTQTVNGQQQMTLLGMTGLGDLACMDAMCQHPSNTRVKIRERDIDIVHGDVLEYVLLDDLYVGAGRTADGYGVLEKRIRQGLAPIEPPPWARESPRQRGERSALIVQYEGLTPAARMQQQRVHVDGNPMADIRSLYATFAENPEEFIRTIAEGQPRDRQAVSDAITRVALNAPAQDALRAQIEGRCPEFCRECQELFNEVCMGHFSPVSCGSSATDAHIFKLDHRRAMAFSQFAAPIAGLLRQAYDVAKDPAQKVQIAQQLMGMVRTIDRRILFLNIDFTYDVANRISLRYLADLKLFILKQFHDCALPREQLPPPAEGSAGSTQDEQIEHKATQLIFDWFQKNDPEKLVDKGIDDTWPFGEYPPLMIEEYCRKNGHSTGKFPKMARNRESWEMFAVFGLEFNCPSLY
ncbi:MAG: hypothetical protein LBC42_03025, partial [Puniceicoccales bacterium]|nr:hypothetical protein [Puniceicoccales bacterium]